MSGSLWESSDVYLDGAPVGAALVTTASRRISYAEKQDPLTVGSDYSPPDAYTGGITADAGSSQGDGALTVAANVTRATFVITTVGTTGDAVTLPTPRAGLEVVVINRGANSADVFPASGDNLGAGANTAAALAAGGVAKYTGIDADTWHPHQ